MKNKIRFNKTVYLYCPDHRIYNYFLHADYVFGINKLILIKNLDIIDDEDCQILLDQNYLQDFLSYQFKSYKKEIYVILWNDLFDKKIHKETMHKINEKFENLNVFFQSNFYPEYKNYFFLNDYNIYNKKTLKKISGAKFRTKMKYFFPIFYSIYNFLKYFTYANNLIFGKKLVFVGRADEEDILNAFKRYYNYKFEYIKNLINNFENYNSKDKIDYFFLIFNEQKFKNLEFQKKYYLVNVIIRFIFVNHLKKFNFFYHKKNSKLPLDLLFSNLYRNICMIDLGSKVGNSKIYTRSLLINKFYKKSKLKVSFFLNDLNYNKDFLFDERTIIIKKYLYDLISFIEFDCSFENLKMEMLKLNKLLE